MGETSTQPFLSGEDAASSTCMTGSIPPEPQDETQIYEANRKRRTKLQGWRFGVAMSAVTAIVVFVTNLVLMVWASTHSYLQDGVGDLYVGDCGVVNDWNIWSHVLINALSSVLLGASNYTMQCVMSPTRTECDAAHAKGIWLDIGVPGLRNITKISPSRRAFWALLAFSSLPIHLLYNSAVFKTMGTNAYDILVADSHSLNITTLNLSNSLENKVRRRYQQDPPSFIEMDPSDCISIYRATFLSDYSDVILVAVPSHMRRLKAFSSTNISSSENSQAQSLPSHDW